MDRRLAHWWNGSWGNLFRRDIELRTDDRAWTVRWWGDKGLIDREELFPDEVAARAFVAWLIEHDRTPNTGWRELPITQRYGPPESDQNST